MREIEIQNSILDYLNRVPGCFAWTNHTHGIMKDGRFRRRGGFEIVGGSDILGVYMGRFLAFEVKTPRGRATPAQLAFLDKVTRCGGIAAIVRSIDEVRERINGMAR